jgi:hypothetical protein
MPGEEVVASFIRSTFPSVWALELLCFLRTHRAEGWTQVTLVAAMRSSELVVAQSVRSLLAAGLVIVHGDEGVRYQPASQSLDDLAEAAERLYAQRPDFVRRTIVSAASSPVRRFADAFKLRKD